MYESITARMYVFLVVFTTFAFYHDFLSKVAKKEIYISTMYIHCRRITVQGVPEKNETHFQFIISLSTGKNVLYTIFRYNSRPRLCRIAA